jgi:hypothetical protein
MPSTTPSVLCIQIDNSGCYPIYYAIEHTCFRLSALFDDRPTIWSINPELTLGIRRAPGRPRSPQFWIYELTDLPSCPEVHWQNRTAEEVNGKFPLLALHTPGVWLRQLNDILGLPALARKHVIDVWSGIQGERVPTRWSRGYRPKYSIH